MSQTTLISILITLVSGGGITVAIIKVWGQIRVKTMDLYSAERLMFIREVNDMRKALHAQEDEIQKMKVENSKFKIQIHENEHLIKKLEKQNNYLISQIKEAIRIYRHNGNVDQLINQIEKHVA